MQESLPKMVDDRIKEFTNKQVRLYFAQGLIMEREKSQTDVAKMIADAIQQEHETLRSEISLQINDVISNHIPSQVDSLVRNYMAGHILHVHPTQATPTSTQEQQHQLYLTLRDNPRLQHNDLPIWIALKYKFEILHVATTPCRLMRIVHTERGDGITIIKKQCQDLNGDDVRNLAMASKRGRLKEDLKASTPSVVRPRDQDDPYDDAHLERENSAKRQRTSEHGTFVFGESSSGQDYKSEPGPLTSSNQEQSNDFDFWTDSYATDDDELPTKKKGSSEPEKIVMSLHKFPIVIFPDDDIEERTSKWIFYINKQRAPGKPKKEVYSHSKIVQFIKTYWELGHEHKFITKIIARRANGSIMLITKLDYKNLNKNDIEDMHLLIVNHKVDDYTETGLLWSLSIFIKSTMIWERVHDFQLGVESYQQNVNLTTPTITFLGIKKYKMFSIVSELVYGVIYENNKKEKKVMRHQEIHKFCDATLKRVLEGLKRYNNDVKHGYVSRSLTKEDVKYLQLFKEEIEERLKYRNQLRRWEMYDILIRASRLMKVMADKGKKSSMETFASNDKADYYSGITSITVNGKNAYELKGKFLDDLHNNAFSGTNGKDAIEHIEYHLKIIDPFKLPNVDHDKLRIVVFPITSTKSGFGYTKKV
ncbi:hypothetical protein Tco_0576604 [Tanacetum coccineum]